MGYRVIVKPEANNYGYLSHGRRVAREYHATYYAHPSGARKAAKSWLKRHPGGKALVVTYRDSKYIEEVTL